MARISKADGQWVNLDKPGGAVFFVLGDTVAYKGAKGSDDYVGTSPEKPKATIDGTNGAHSLCVADRGDTIVVMPGTVTLTAAVALDVADVTLTGFYNTGPKTRNPSILTTATDSVALVSVEAANVCVENLTLTNTATTSDTYMIDVGQATASPSCIFKNLFLDMEGGAATLNGIHIGDGALVCSWCHIEGCVIYDLDDVGITIKDASIGCLVKNCDIYDLVSANTALEGIDVDADCTHVEKCYIRVSAASASAQCISVAATAQEFVVRDTSLCAFGAGAHGVLFADGATGCCMNIFVSANALNDTVQHTTDVDGYSGVVGWASAPADGTAPELINPAAA